MENDDTIDLLAYAKRLWQHWIPAAVVALAVLAASFGFHMLKGDGPVAEADHAAKAHVMVQFKSSPSQGESVQQADLLSQWMRTFVALEDVPLLVDPVVKAMGDGYDAEQVAERTSVYWGGGSMLLAVNATAPKEDDAVKMANAAAQALVAHAAEIVKLPKDQVPTMVQVEDAKVTSDQPNQAVAAANGFAMPLVAALGAGVLTAFVLELRQSRRGRREAATAAR